MNIRVFPQNELDQFNSNTPRINALLFLKDNEFLMNLIIEFGQSFIMKEKNDKTDMIIFLSDNLIEDDEDILGVLEFKFIHKEETKKIVYFLQMNDFCLYPQ